MIRIGPIVALLLLAGCGAAPTPQPTPTPASVPDAGAGRDHRPLVDPPRQTGAASPPPPAWVHTRRGSRWLAFGSYCWSAPGHSACIDMVGTELRHDVPTVVVRPGELVRFHLAFAADSVDLYVGRSTQRVLHRGKTRVVAWRIPSARGDRILTLDIRGAGGSATYLAQLRVS